MWHVVHTFHNYFNKALLVQVVWVTDSIVLHRSCQGWSYICIYAWNTSCHIILWCALDVGRGLRLGLPFSSQMNNNQIGVNCIRWVHCIWYRVPEVTLPENVTMLFIAVSYLTAEGSAFWSWARVTLCVEVLMSSLCPHGFPLGSPGSSRLHSTVTMTRINHLLKMRDLF